MKAHYILISLAFVLPACGTVKGAASDAGVVGKTAVRMVTDIPLPPLPQFDPEPYAPGAEGAVEYCAALADRYKFGRGLSKDGDKLVAEGRVAIERGSRLVREGERKIETAGLTLAEARRDLGLRTGRIKALPEDIQSLEDPDSLKTIRARLDGAIRRLESGNDMVERGTIDVANGQARLKRGIEFLDEGQKFMAEDEGRCTRQGTIIVGDAIMGTEEAE